MAVHIVVDGYNFIRCSPELKALDRQDLQLGREALADMLAEYKRTKGHRITAVFDGRNALPGQEVNFQKKGVRFVFSRGSRSADDVIKGIAAREREKAVIVSSDGDVMRYCSSQGATAVRSEVFEHTIQEAVYTQADAGEDTPAATAHTAGTKKKGPSRRLSKKARQTRRKVAKLS
jgi:predicted RNA-binding protein with PIN domain